jgi:hypothetical protein
LFERCGSCLDHTFGEKCYRLAFLVLAGMARWTSLHDPSATLKLLTAFPEASQNSACAEVATPSSVDGSALGVSKAIA